MLHISDKHTSGALRSAKVDGYNFECETVRPRSFCTFVQMPCH